MATVLFKGGLSGGTEMGGGLSNRLHPPTAFIHLRELTFPHHTSALPVLFLGGPRASPSSSGTCTPPMRLSMVSEGL